MPRPPAHHPSRPEPIRRVGLPDSPLDVAGALRQMPGFVFLDSATADLPGQAPGGLSIVSALPLATVEGNLFADRAPLRDALDSLVGRSGTRGPAPDTGVPHGGLIGMVGYEGGFRFGVYDALLAYDHASADWFEVGGFLARPGVLDALGRPPRPSPHEPVGFLAEMGRASFEARVRAAQAFIAAGDIYQVNLARRFSAPWAPGRDLFPFYRNLRAVSPAPMAAFLDLGGCQVASSSPELFLRMSGNSITTRPIKGTRPRFRDPARDEKSAYDLITSPKEIAELVMITDLERNDLGRVCEFGSVAATELLKVERFEQVFHLVSTVRGTLRPDVGHLDALHKCFPGGSITGAPKKRAREIIAQLEPVPRGLYTGAIGYLGANGESQFNIAIRTAVAKGRHLTFHSGAGIVADSIPTAEFDETEHKAAGLIAAAAQL